MMPIFYERKKVMSENILDTLNMAFGHVENFVWELDTFLWILKI